MGLRSDTHRCRALVYGVERSSYQANVAPKGFLFFANYVRDRTHGCPGPYAPCILLFPYSTLVVGLLIRWRLQTREGTARCGVGPWRESSREARAVGARGWGGPAGRGIRGSLPQGVWGVERIAVGTAVTEDTSVTSVTRGRPLLALKLVKTSPC